MKRDPSHLKRDLLKDEVLSQALRGLPARTPPPSLRTALRVIASRHRHRILGRQGLGWGDRARLFATNLMRPLALPFAGGVFSTVVLFSMWMIPTYPVRGTGATDVPTALSTEATVNQIGPIGSAGEDVIVDVTVNDQGRMVDYTIVSGHSELTDASLKRSIETILLFTTFTPATALGQPVSGKMRLLLSKSHIDVKG
jgi:hypothetical protein